MPNILIHCAHDKLVPIKDLNPHPKNPNKHSNEQIDRLAKILEYQGFRYPIKVSNKSGFITSGHGRLMAAKKLKLKEVPVNFQDYTDDEQEWADIVADNAIASWAELDLSAINHELENLGPDFDIDLLGIKDFVIEPADKIDPQCDEDEIPEHVEPRTKLGDLYVLGSHRLLCGDSTNIQHVERLMDGNKADITFTSPPYNLGGYENTDVHKYANRESDIKSEQDYKQFLIDFLSAAQIASNYQFVNLQLSEPNKRAIIEWQAFFINNFSDLIIWDKAYSPIAVSNVFNRQFECIFVFGPGNPQNQGMPFDVGSEPNIFQLRASGKIEKNDFNHKAMFPVELPEKFINFLKKNGTVFDPFGGSGSTLIACEKTNRQCFMSELDPHYVDVIVQRWMKYSGKMAYLVEDSTGKLKEPVPYAEIASFRGENMSDESKSIAQKNVGLHVAATER